jgi:hypothetical protein
MLLELLKKIKSSKVRELEEVVYKLQFRSNEFSELTLNDLNDALNCCIYHFTGGFYESMGEICPCNCICENCEMIPEHPVHIRMQEICKTMAEENVMTEFIEKFSKETNDQKNEC